MAMTMADLLAKNSSKFISLVRGDYINGKVVSVESSDIIIDVGSKAEGVLNKKDLPAEKLNTLKVGETLKCYVLTPESESGQVLVSLFAPSSRFLDKRGTKEKKWQKFITALDRKNTLSAQVLEINSGGLLVEVEGIRGFIPTSHISFDEIVKKGGIGNLVGETIPVNVIEVDPGNNRLIFSSRKNITDSIKEKLKQLEIGQEVTGKIISVAPFGLLISVDGLEGTVMSREISWEEKDFTTQFAAGQEIKVKVIGKDEALGKVNLSIRQLSEDPFEKLSQDFQTDDVVTGTVLEVSQNGLNIGLEEGLNGFLPSGKIDDVSNYQVGQKSNFLVDSVDKSRRRINLVPFITSTKGLIYK